MFSTGIKTAAAAVLTASVFLGGAAGATTMHGGMYDATSVSTGGNLHTVWLPGLLASPYDNYWQFEDGAGTMSVYSDTDTINVSGRIVNNGNEANGTNYLFDVDMNFAYREAAGENAETRQAPKTGGGAENETWEYFNLTSATLTGAGDLDGVVLELFAFSKSDTRDQPFQIGMGANDKNSGLGASSWFAWTANDKAAHFGITDSSGHQHGDLNVNLEPVPLPAAGWLLMAGVAGLGAMRRRRTHS